MSPNRMTETSATSPQVKTARTDQKKTEYWLEDMESKTVPVGEKLKEYYKRSEQLLKMKE